MPARSKPMVWAYGEYAGQVAVRFPQYKAVRQGLLTPHPSDWEIYDLDADPGETRDLASDNHTPGLPPGRDRWRMHLMPHAGATQGELDFDGRDAAGYGRWQEEQAAWLARLRRECGFPLGRKVRVKLRDFDREIQGRLGLVELPLQPATSRLVKFRVGTFEFAAEEIEYCLRED